MAMSALTSITNGTTADATEVDGNFGIIEDHINAELIHRDGSIAMTGDLTLADSSPGSDLVAASKGYVDGVIPQVVCTLTTTTEFTIPTKDVAFNWSATGSGPGFETETGDTWLNPAFSGNTTLLCPTSGIYAITGRITFSATNSSYGDSTYAHTPSFLYAPVDNQARNFSGATDFSDSQIQPFVMPPTYLEATRSLSFGLMSGTATDYYGIEVEGIELRIVRIALV